MIHAFGRSLLAGFVVIAAIGCEPRPVVVDPDDGDTTIIEDDADVNVVPNGTTTEPRTGVDVQVGGGEGVDVNVNPPDSNPTGSPAGTSTDATQNTSTPDARQ